MIIHFRNSKLEKLVNSKNDLIRKYGQRQAEALVRRLGQLESISNLALVRLSAGARCHELKADRAGQFSVDLVHPYRLIFVPTNDPIPYKPDGGLDWSRITQIEIIEVIDTHG